MGVAGSVAAAVGIPDDIKSLFELTERQKEKIGEIDNAMLEAEMGKMFKGHNKIIDELCARSKAQLKSFLEKYPGANKQLDNLNSSGNQYAKFIQQCGVPKVEFDFECIKSSGEYDEDLLVAIIGTSSVKDLKKLNDLFTAENSFGIADLFSTKNKADSGLSKFIQRVFRFNRSESKEIDRDEAESAMESLHKAGASRLLGADEDAIIDILSTASRAQCMAINEVYQRKYKMKLERAINMKFKGNFSKLLILWSMPLPSAIVSGSNFLMQKIIPDKAAILRYFARFDKDMLKMADAACRELHQQSLSEFLSSVLSGNSLRAIKVWIEEASPDKGFQKIIDVYIDGKLDEGYSFEEIFQNAELLAKLQFLLEKLASELKLFQIEHKVKIDPGDLAIINSSQAGIQGLAKTVSDIRLKQQSMRVLTDLALSHDDENENENNENLKNHNGHGGHPLTAKHRSPTHMDFDIPECVEEDEAGGINGNGEAEVAQASKEMMNNRKFSIVLADNIQRKVHDQLVNHTYAYLISVFEDADEDAEGSLETNLFWETLSALPIKEFGFVPRDIELIKMTSAWDIDGRVYYYEALLEFSDSVVTAIGNKEIDENEDEGNTGSSSDARDVIKIIDRLMKEKENKENQEDRLGGDITFGMDRAVYASKSSSRRTLSIRFGNIPVYFRQYVIDTVGAFDLDFTGCLKDSDIPKLLEAMQIPAEVLTLQTFVDNFAKSMSNKGKVGLFDLKYCAETVFRAINNWFGDGMEHYICLIDKASGAYFWFNTLDQSTQWVDNSITGEISSEFKDFVLDENMVNANTNDNNAVDLHADAKTDEDFSQNNASSSSSAKISTSSKESDKGTSKDTEKGNLGDEKEEESVPVAESKNSNVSEDELQVESGIAGESSQRSSRKGGGDSKKLSGGDTDGNKSPRDNSPISTKSSKKYSLESKDDDDGNKASSNTNEEDEKINKPVLSHAYTSPDPLIIASTGEENHSSEALTGSSKPLETSKSAGLLVAQSGDDQRSKDEVTEPPSEPVQVDPVETAE